MANDINTLSDGATVTGAEVTKDGDLMVSIRDDSTGLQTPIYAGKIDVSDVVVDKLKNYAPISATIRPIVIGNPAICEDSAAWAFQGLKIYGKSTQNGEPSPENPVPIVSAGDGGSVVNRITGKNLMNFQEGAEYGVNNVSQTIQVHGGQIITVKMSQTLLEIGDTGSKQAQHWIAYNNSAGDNISKGTICHMKFTDVGQTLEVASVQTVPENSATLTLFVNPYFGDRSPTVKNNFVMVTFGSDQSIPYAPYQGEQILSVSTPNGLPGIPVKSGGNFTDVDGQQWICDVKDYSAGKYTQKTRKKIFNNGDGWSLSGLVSGRFVYPVGASSVIGNIGVMCSAYKVSYGSTNKGDCWLDANCNFYCNTSFLTLEDWGAYLSENPMTIIYPIATPVETDIPAEELAAYRALTSYDGTTVISTPEPVAGIEASYVMDGNEYKDSVDKRLSALEAAQTGI